VDIDQTCVYSLVNNFPDTVLFTELGGTSLIRGVMKLVTGIDIEWVRPLFPNMMKVDLFRLAKIKFEQSNRAKIQEKKNKKEEELKKK
jgi:ATP-dependent RNA helicase DHX8/PRP22